MTKRKVSGGGGAPAKPKAAKKGGTANIPADSLKLPHIRLFDDWASLFSITRCFAKIIWLLNNVSSIQYVQSIRLRQENLVKVKKTLDVLLTEELRDEDTSTIF